MSLREPAVKPATWRGRAAFWWIALTSLAIAVSAPLPYATGSLEQLGRSEVGLAEHYAGQPAAVQAALYVHMAFAGVALLLSPLQFVGRLRLRSPGAHRTVGRVVLACVVTAGCAGLVIAPFSYAGLVGTVGFGCLALLWLIFAVTALRAIRHGEVAAHRRWMVRTFALTYAGVMLRIWTGLLLTLQQAAGTEGDLAFDRAYYPATFLAWVPNLVVAEWYLRNSNRDDRVTLSP